VTASSDALDLKHDVFRQNSPAAIAKSLKRSADRSRRRKSDPYRSAMSMLVFYINRAGENLPATRKRRLEAARDELRKAFGKAGDAYPLPLWERVARSSETRSSRVRGEFDY
jgi:hypothetical protein